MNYSSNNNTNEYSLEEYNFPSLGEHFNQNLFSSTLSLAATLTLNVLSIKWKNKNNYVSDSQCRTLAYGIKDFYDRNSNKKLSIIPKVTRAISVEYNAARKNLNKAEQSVMRKVPKSDIYCLINNNVKSYNNAGNRIAHLKGSLIRTGIHEVGHILGLGHSGAYTKTGYNPYADRNSVMGRYASPYLTLPQYFHMGWVTKEDIVTIVLDQSFDELILFGLKKINELFSKGNQPTIDRVNELFKEKSQSKSNERTKSGKRSPNNTTDRNESNIVFEQNSSDRESNEEIKAGELYSVQHNTTAYKAGVRFILPKNSRTAFLSLTSKNLYALHMSNGGGSQLIKLFKNSYQDHRFTNLNINVTNNKIKITLLNK